MRMLNDFTKTNKWLRVKKKFTTPKEMELLNYIELLERQIVTLEVMK